MKYILILLFVLSFCSSYSQRFQKSDDLGIFIGGSYYEGDINYGRFFYNPKLSFGLVYRRNISAHYGLRFGLTKAKLSAYDSDFKANEYQIVRNQEFEDNHIIDLSAMLEFNFFPITDDKNTDNLSPYFTFGIAFYNTASTEQLLNFAIPVGVGLKYKLSPKWTIQAEWNYRFTFTDKLDGLTQIAEPGNTTKSRSFQNRQFSFNYTNDMYSIFGISLLYQIRKKSLECPGYE